MEFRNWTPFPALAYQALNVDGALHHVVAIRETLLVSPDGTLTHADVQLPLAVEDEYFGEMNRSSVRQESDLVPFKPRCDVIVVATAYAPSARPTQRFEVRVRILSPESSVLLNKTLVVTGPRFWEKRRFGGWRLSEPEPITSLPIRYEYAYGGEQRLGAHRSGYTVARTNPVGRGFSEEWFRKAEAVERIAAPQIESPAAPVRVFGESLVAEGLGVITKAWLPRLSLAGNVDPKFPESDRWLPDDFDFAFWNGAHPDLQLPYLAGDETIELTNLTPEDMLSVTLPGHRPYVLVRYVGGDILPVPVKLDTLVIDIERRAIAVVRRLTLASEPAVRALEARLITRADWDLASALSNTPGAAKQTPLHSAANA